MEITQAATDYRGLLAQADALIEFAHDHALKTWPDWNTMSPCWHCAGTGTRGGQRKPRLCAKCGGWGHVDANGKALKSIKAKGV